MKNLISIRVCIYKLAKHEARVVKAKFVSSDSIITWVMFYSPIRCDIWPQIIPKYRVFLIAQRGQVIRRNLAATSSHFNDFLYVLRIFSTENDQKLQFQCRCFGVATNLANYKRIFFPNTWGPFHSTKTFLAFQMSL